MSALRIPFLFILLFWLGCSSTPKTVPVPEAPVEKPLLKVKKNKPKDLNGAAKKQDEDSKRIEEYLKEINFEVAIDPKKWKEISNETGIQTYEKMTQAVDRVAFRGEMLVPSSLERIATVLNDYELRKQWIDSLVEAHQVKRISLLERIEYNHTKVQWPFQDRDFLYHVDIRVAKKPKTMMLVMKSIEDPAEPPQKDRVRGEIIYSYYYMKEIEPKTSTKVIIEMSVDPKGEIPKWLVELAQKKWPYNTLKRMRAMALKKDLVVAEEIETYFKDKKGKK